MKSLNVNKPHLIITVGIPGSGKSYFAENFSETFKAPIISNWKLRKIIYKNPSFSIDEDKIIDNLIVSILDEVLKTGRTVIYDGLTSLKSDRISIAKKAKESGYEALFVWVQTEQSTALNRSTKSNKNSPLITVESFNSKLKQFSPPSRLAKTIVISGKHTFESQLKIVLKHLANPCVEKAQSERRTRTILKRNILIR